MHTVPMSRANLAYCSWMTTRCYGGDVVFTDWIRPHPTGFDGHWPHVFTNRLKEFFIAANQGGRVMVSDDSDKFYNREKGEEVIGYAAWERVRGTDALTESKCQAFSWSDASRWHALESRLLSLEGRYDQWLDADKAYEKKALRSFLRGVIGAQKKLKELVAAQSKERGFIYLEECHCEPKFQRNGVGKRLVQQGLDQATAENVPVCLIASDVGEKLYSKLGFRRVGMAYYGQYSSPAMVWYPPGWKIPDVEHFVVDSNLENAPEGQRS